MMKWKVINPTVSHKVYLFLTKAVVIDVTLDKKSAVFRILYEQIIYCTVYMVVFTDYYVKQYTSFILVRVFLKDMNTFINKDTSTISCTKVTVKIFVTKNILKRHLFWPFLIIFHKKNIKLHNCF